MKTALSLFSALMIIADCPLAGFAAVTESRSFHLSVTIPPHIIPTQTLEAFSSNNIEKQRQEIRNILNTREWSKVVRNNETMIVRSIVMK